MDTIPWDAVGTGSGWVVVAFLVILLFRGKVIPASTHDEIIANLREQNAALRETNKHLAEQNSVMLGTAIPTVNSVLTALRQAAGDQS